MRQPTGGSPPRLLQYRTWRDASGLHARLLRDLPAGALRYGCVQEIHAGTVLELTQGAVRNRVKVWAWETG